MTTVPTRDPTRETLAVGTATYPSRRCQWCGRPAQIYDIDGCWCSPQCQHSDRASETTWRRRWQS